MRNPFPILTLLVALLIAPVTGYSADRDVTLYKNPGCTCCDGYAEHLRAAGYKVNIQETEELGDMQRAAGIPDDMQGCHFFETEGYAISGHVPVAAVEKLFTERPDIRAISLPGMPLGSPGMGGQKEGPFEVLGISASGDITGVFSTE